MLSSNEETKLLNIGQASKYLGVSIDTLRRWEKKGKIKTYRSPGGHRYFRKTDLDKVFGTKYERDETHSFPKGKKTTSKIPAKIEPQITENVKEYYKDELKIPQIIKSRNISKYERLLFTPNPLQQKESEQSILQPVLLDEEDKTSSKKITLSELASDRKLVWISLLMIIFTVSTFLLILGKRLSERILSPLP